MRPGIKQLTLMRLAHENGKLELTDIMDVYGMKESEENRRIARGKAEVLETMGYIKKVNAGYTYWILTKTGRMMLKEMLKT